MNKFFSTPVQTALVIACVLLAGLGLGYLWGNQPGTNGKTADVGHASAAAKEPEVLYWYDPMVPNQHFDQPGKSPFMDMDLVPKYANQNGGGNHSNSLRIDPGVVQNLGMRLAPVKEIRLQNRLEVSGTLAFNERELAIVQMRAAAFVERVWPLAEGDFINRGEPLAEMLVPEWVTAQYEFLALKAADEPHLLDAARARLRLLGMKDAHIKRVERTRAPIEHFAVTAPISGVIRSLEVRTGMTLSSGRTLAHINSIDSLWLDAAIPEALMGRELAVKVGDKIDFYPANSSAEPVQAKIESLLPELDSASRSLRARALVDNSHQQLRPGMTGQVRVQASGTTKALAVPTEAIIRSGQQALIMVAEGEGRFRPQAVTIGQELGDQTVVLQGLAEGQQVVASGQFLLDSEASLLGLLATSATEIAISETGHVSQAQQSPLHTAEGDILAIDSNKVRLRHGPFPTLAMPGMTMNFRLANPALAAKHKVGDRVQIGVRETDEGLIVERLEARSIAGDTGSAIPNTTHDQGENHQHLMDEPPAQDHRREHNHD